MSDEEAEFVDVEMSAGDLDPVVGMLREFLHRSGAIRAVVLLDRGDGAAAPVVDVAQLSPVEITDGERSYVLPHAVELDADPLPVPDVRQLPRFDVDAESGEVASPLGGMGHYADAARALADACGGRSVVLVTFATNDPQTPLSLSAREGEPLLVSLGEEAFELPSL